MNDVLDEVDRLAGFPRAGHPLPEFPDTPYLEILARKSFRVIYHINGKTCFFVTIRRTSMLLDEAALEDMNAVS